MKDSGKKDGFSGQIQHVVPGPVLGRLTRHQLAAGLRVTDLGWYPNASGHRRRRVAGGSQHILVFCVSGRGWYEAGRSAGSVEANQALLIPRGMAHAYGSEDGDPWSIHWAHFTGTDASWFLSLLGGGGNPVVPVDLALAGRLRDLFVEASEALAEGFALPGFVCASQAVRHLLCLLFFANRAFHPETRVPFTVGLEASIRYLRERVDENLTVSAMAREAGLSATHFSRLFRQHTGFSPMEYFIHLKMQRAARFLSLTSLKVKEVAARLGYEDPYYFSRLFRRVMGVSPTEYRREMAGGVEGES